MSHPSARALLALLVLCLVPGIVIGGTRGRVAVD
jgi:hypothetical protein